MNRTTRPFHWPRLLAVASSMLLASCTSSLRSPPLVAQPIDAYALVPYPPPAALVEAVPPSPDSSAVWMDGYWTWQNQFYVWLRGGWLLVPEGAHFAYWQAFYTRDGQLMFAPGAWYGLDGARIRPPAILVSADTPANDVTAEFQTAR